VAAARYAPGSPEQAVLDLVREHLTPLQQKTRDPVAVALAERLIALERPRAGYTRPQELALLTTRMQRIGHELEDELGGLDRRFAVFEERWFARSGERERRDLLVAYLHETVRDPRERRADLRALDRFLDYDAVRERHVVARHRVLVKVELALTFMGRAAAAALADRAARPDELMHELFAGGKLDDFLRARGEKGARWQVRHAAWDALARALRAAQAFGSLEAFEAGSLGAAVRAATNRDEHPWVQGIALELVVLLSPRFGDSLLTGRLLDRPAELAPRDFLVRRQVVDLLAEAGDDRALALLGKLLAARDPSEHVRVGVPEAVARCRAPGTGRLLRIAAGLDAEVPEPSAKVRAAAALAARAALAHALAHTPIFTVDRVTAAADLFVGVLQRDRDSLPLEIACAEAAALCRDLGELARRDVPPGDPAAQAARLLPELGARLQTALLELSAKSGRAPHVHEAAAAAAEEIARLLAPDADAWQRYLAAVVAEIPPGGARRLALSRTPAGLPPLPDDPIWLGRILAQLTRRDWGLAARRHGDLLTLWRGDHFRRRLWRVVHELSNRAPNKRQAFLHTIGRRQHGDLRAPPGGLDEVTATVVPGERVTIEGEGSWARHLPTVDELLDLPLLEGGPVRLFSSHGTTTLTPPATRWQRLRTRLGLTFGYAGVAHARLAALRGVERHERQRYLAEVKQAYGIEASFARYPYPGRRADAPEEIAALFAGSGPPPPPAETDATVPFVKEALALAGPVSLLHDARDWLDLHGYYFLSPSQNSQVALALFAAGFAGLFFVESWWKRRRIDRARAQIPLTIGGWGTRGKSGTERLKAALFHGLGHEVFVKTTGCESMIIHSVPDEPARELFIFRSYDKATIWEVRDTLELAATLGSEIYLWECMALLPKYVELLQRSWVRDDLVTLTNAYPDHEDIQGPAGVNIAECISAFIPERGTCITSEVNFLPLFADAARERGTRLVAVAPTTADLIADDLLALFPYSEHPRNIALVARVAEEYGIDRNFAIATMAEHVVPDLGVLKVYPTARVRGRQLSFVNGMSANERTGFLNNWTRMGLGEIDAALEPERVVVTVVNNRADRVSRSEVFARIVVEDAAADAHVLIGTNLSGLQSYLRHELDQFLPDLHVVVADDLSVPGSPQPRARLTRHLARLRVPPPDPAQASARARVYAPALGLTVDETAVEGFETALARAWAAGAELDVVQVRAELGADADLAAATARLFVTADTGDAPAAAPPEVAHPPERAELDAAFLGQLARLAVHARLAERLARLVAEPGDSPDLDGFHAAFRAAYRALFLDSLVIVEDAAETGDAIIDRCARAVPPGTLVTVMGIQNIKGTGLDFVYRWQALDIVTGHLARLADPDARAGAVRALESFEDYGLIDAGAAAAALAAVPRADWKGDDLVYLDRVQAKVAKVHADRLDALGRANAKDAKTWLLDRVESWLDPLDSLRRYRHAERVMKDLVAHRISHNRAAVEMRRLYERQKGGWLAETVLGQKD
jgi:poly-gamma-glutamate synthase PgsB/CapB